MRGKSPEGDSADGYSYFKLNSTPALLQVEHNKDSLNDDTFKVEFVLVGGLTLQNVCILWPRPDVRYDSKDLLNIVEGDKEGRT